MLDLDYKKLLKHKCLLVFVIILFTGFVSFSISGYYLQKQLMNIYNQQNSVVLQDRTGNIISIQPNLKGYWSQYLDEVPLRFEELLLKKEDKYFYYHFGINPWTTSKAALGYFGFRPKTASSTITQQLVKILLERELERNLKNKIIESFYTVSLEFYQSKETILKMYGNSVYFGNGAQGLAEAGHLYFNLSPELLTDGQILQLLATLSSPTINNPSQDNNKENALYLSQKLDLDNQDLVIEESSIVKENMANYSRSSDTYFEIRNLTNNSSESQQLTIDKELTEKVREIVDRNIIELKEKNVQNGAVIIIKLPENELLALIGSPNPNLFENGYQINMLLEPRPIGSTVKPFIYLKSFEKGLRPYTLVNDREYKYITALGFPLYPKNFDYEYRGETSLHYSLSNSLNVPAVKVLEYVGLENFYNLLEQDLEFKPIQDLNNYQLGIALGALEMSLWDLARYFTIFPNNGMLKEVKIYKNDKDSFLQKQIASPEYVQLINKILNDRSTGIEQFGLKSDFNLFQSNYALKTGTSRNFQDSWVVGYTPDFLVGVWLGNSDNTPMEEISGQMGAGTIWAETMNLLLNSEHNEETPFEFNLIKEFYKDNNIEYGLSEDDYGYCLNILKEDDFSLILNPHNEDSFLLEEDTEIILKAKENVKWFINNEFLNQGENAVFSPNKIGQYKIKAESFNGFQEIVIIYIN